MNLRKSQKNELRGTFTLTISNAGARKVRTTSPLTSTSSNELKKVFLGVLLAEYIAQSKKEVLLFSHQTYQEILDRKA